MALVSQAYQALANKRNTLQIKHPFEVQVVVANKSIDNVSDERQALCGRRRMSPLLNIRSMRAELSASKDKTRQASMCNVGSCLQYFGQKCKPPYGIFCSSTTFIYRENCFRVESFSVDCIRSFFKNGYSWIVL